jgi:hypothetical protein
MCDSPPHPVPTISDKVLCNFRPIVPSLSQSPSVVNNWVVIFDEFCYCGDIVLKRTIYGRSGERIDEKVVFKG